MKINKVVEIKNLGKFKDHSAKGNLIFTDFCIIYGENGKGKTTFSTILRSLKSGDTSLLYEKKSTEATGPISIKLLLENNQLAEFNEVTNQWSLLNPDLEIFDSVHVNNNVYSGDRVEHNHKKNLYYLVIGETGVQLAKEIEDLTVAIKEQSTELNSLENSIKSKIISKIDVESYIHLTPIENLEEKIIETNNQLTELQEIEGIHSKPIPSLLLIPSFKFDELKNLLIMTLDDVSEDARLQVIAHSSSLGERAESWLKQGLDYIEVNDSPNCPFCQQSLNNSNAIEQYQAYFSKSYANLKTQIDSFYQSFSNDFPESKISEIQQVFTKNDSLLDYWARFINFEVDSPKLEELFTTRKQILEKVQTLLLMKKDKPLDQIEIGSNVLFLFSQYAKLVKNFSSYNKQIEKTNSLIQDKKNKTSKTDIEKIREQKTNLEENQIRFSNQVIQLCDSFVTKQNDLETTKKSKQQKSDELKLYSETVLEKYRTKINNNLRKFGAEFEIVEAKTSFAGGKPSTSYCLSINGKTISLGTADTTGEPCFRTVLSDGDKSSLAFAFFLAQLQTDPNLSKKTIIVDDPITSLDSHRKQATFQEIKRISECARQCIVLSHDQSFLHHFWKEIYSVKPLQIIRDGQQSKFSEWDIQTDTQPEYLKDYYRLENFIEKGDSDLLGVVRCIRPVLEGNLRVRFPKAFEPNHWLGNFIEKIKNAKPNSQFSRVKQFVSDLEDINDYSKQYHHQQNPLADKTPIDETELVSYTRRTLELIEKF